MQGAFPNAPQPGNILYLVSSALPERANLLVWAAGMRRMQLVWNQNGVAYPGWHGSGWEAVNVRMRTLMQQARHVFYQSAFSRMASDMFLGPCGQAAEILPNPVDTSRFVPLGPPAQPETLVILAGGTCYQRYRFEVAAQTLRCLLDAGVEARLHFAGRPAWGAEAAREAIEILAKLGIAARVEFLPPYSQQQAPAVIGAAHVLLHTKYNDNCPTLVLESMACGLPVVYSSSGGTPELVGPDAGIGIPAPLDWERPHPPDPAALADAIRHVLAEYPERAAFARRRAVEHFDVLPWLARHRLVFERLLEQR
jgi:glycosyltransferase involved in cell wall biosynthesis